MNEVFEFLTTNPTFYLSTIDGDQARVRPFGAVANYEGKLYFATNNKKSVFKQLVANPKVEISTTSPKGEWIRLSGNAVVDSRQEAKAAMLEFLKYFILQMLLQLLVLLAVLNQKHLNSNDHFRHMDLLFFYCALYSIITEASLLLI
jgi:uncharacterized pyridoxamine 5'-phosphate oxidase family protein